MAKLLPYFRWFPADAESDDKYSAMTDEELGFFHRCLNKSWMNGGLPADPVRRSQVMRTAPKTADRLWLPFCWEPHPLDPSKVVNPRQEVERSEAMRSSEARSLAGQKGGKRSAMLKQCLSDPQPRAYGSVSESESVFESSEEIRKTKVAEVLARGLAPIDNRLTVEELETAWERHRKHRNDQPMVNVFRMVHAQNGTLDSERFRDRHPRWCEYWNRRDWSFCPLTLWEWIEQGMPLPPAEAIKNNKHDALEKWANEK